MDLGERGEELPSCASFLRGDSGAEEERGGEGRGRYRRKEERERRNRKEGERGGRRERMADLHNMTKATNRATSSLGLSSPAASAAAACS